MDRPSKGRAGHKTLLHIHQVNSESNPATQRLLQLPSQRCLRVSQELQRFENDLVLTPQHIFHGQETLLAAPALAPARDGKQQRPLCSRAPENAVFCIRAASEAIKCNCRQRREVRRISLSHGLRPLGGIIGVILFRAPGQGCILLWGRQTATPFQRLPVEKVLPQLDRYRIYALLAGPGFRHCDGVMQVAHTDASQRVQELGYQKPSKFRPVFSLPNFAESLEPAACCVRSRSSLPAVTTHQRPKKGRVALIELAGLKLLLDHTQDSLPRPSESQQHGQATKTQTHVQTKRRTGSARRVRSLL